MNTKSESPDLNPEESAKPADSTEETAGATPEQDETGAPEEAAEGADAPEAAAAGDEADSAEASAPAEADETPAQAAEDPAPAEADETPAQAAEDPAPVEADETPAQAAEDPAPAEADETPAQAGEVESESTTVSAEPAEVVIAEDETGEASSDDAAKEVAAAVEADSRLGHKLKKGQRVDVKLVQVDDKDAFVDWGGPNEGTIASAELKDDKGELRVPVGESFTAIVRELGDTVVFTVGRSKGGDLLRMRELESAFEGKIPVPGKVRSTNKGGFEVDLSGVRAFCPFSQIDTIYCENPEIHVGKEYPFQIITFERGGRNIVVSRRGILESEQKEEAQKTRQNLEIGAVLKGRVRRIQPYGAFVDIGGLDGLVHVSEISRAHIRNPKDVLSVGQDVEVKVVGLDGLGTKKERVSLSMKALAPDPWDGAADRWKVGTGTKGRVVRLTDFGAFVELAPGVDGLVHVSQIASERIGHPSDVLSPNQEVEVRILDIDVDAHRISLTMRPEGEEGPPSRGAATRGRRPPRERAPMEYTATPEESGEEVDVSDMEYDDAVAALKKKFEQ